MKWDELEKAVKAAQFTKSPYFALTTSEISELLSVMRELAEALSEVMYLDNGKPEWQISRAALARYEGEQHD